MPVDNRAMAASASLSISAVDLASQTWVFTQSQPLDTREFIRQAKRWSIRLNPQLLRALYRSGELQPLLEIRAHRIGPPDEQERDEPEPRGTFLIEIREARREGRLVDPALRQFRVRLRFDDRRRSDPDGWWNRLIYSRWQLLALPHLHHRLLQARAVHAGERSWVRLPQPRPDQIERGNRLRRIAIALTGLEARYLPRLDPGWVHLTNAEEADWRRYRDTVTAEVLRELLRYNAEQAYADAEWLLFATHDLDPMGDWSRLVRRAHRRRWESLTGNARAAMEHRFGAEILLRFCEDLAESGLADPVPAPSGPMWGPLVERLSHQPDELDEVLQDLGVSPHPRAVLAMEGDTEAAVMPRVFDALGWRLAPDLLRIINLGGVNRNLTLFSAFTVAPLVGQRHGADYDLIRPLTRLVLAVDPDKGYATAEQVASRRREILAAIREVVATQNATVHEADLEELVHIDTWPAPCFEYAHFTFQELAAALRLVHPDCGGLSDERLADALEQGHKHRQDIKQVWSSWRPKVSKIKLADALWPVLAKRIDAAIRGEADAPPIAVIAEKAYLLAQQYRHVHVVLRAADGDEAE
jgi:hypothetical protein